MAKIMLEERVAQSEERARALISHQGEFGRAKDWRRTAGAFTGDDVMRDVFEEGRKIREAERKRTQRSRPKQRKTAS